MQIIWLGHGSFRIEIAGQVLLIDPWLTGNPVLEASQHEAAIAGATHILLTHAHFDHSVDIVDIATRLNIPVIGQYDLLNHWGETKGIEAIAMNKGGTVRAGDVTISMVNACHSSTLPGPDGPVTAGSECGYMIGGEGHMIYASGDTDVMADMGWMGEYYAPDIGILCAGGHYTMDMKAAAFAARKFFNFKVVIPGHYKTMPILAQNADALRDGLPGVDVRTPEVMEPVVLP